MIPPGAIYARWRTARARLDAAGIDALVVSDAFNFAYFTGHASREFDKRFRHLIFVLDRSGDGHALIPDAAAAAMQAAVPALRLSPYTREPISAEAIAAFLRHILGPGPARLGLEGSGVDRPALTGKLLRDVLSLRLGSAVVDASQVLERLRLIKQEEEVVALKAAGDLALAGWDAALTRFRVGMSVHEGARCLAMAFAALGADYNFPGHIEVGNATSPASTTVERGDVLWCDFGVTWDGYHADVSRRATFGLPSPDQIDSHRAGYGLLDTLIEALKPGLTIGECMAPMLMRRRDLHDGQDPPRRFGHGIGLCAAELPSLQWDEPTVLEPGMVLTPEPSFRSRTGEVVHLEDMVLVGRDGPVPLTRGADILYRVD